MHWSTISVPPIKIPILGYNPCPKHTQTSYQVGHLIKIRFAIDSRDIPLLVGGLNHLEKYESMGRFIPYIMENKTCLKPPTRL